MKTPFTFSILLVTISLSPEVASAQQQVEIKLTEQGRQQVQAFEVVLKGAVNTAASKLNQRVREALPNRPTALLFQREVIVTGAPMPDGGAVFHMMIPAIEAVDLRIALLQGEQLARPRPPIPGGAARPVGATVVDPDPSIAAAPPAPVVPLTDPDKEYAQFMRASIIDAMLDGALALPIAEGKNLTVLADELQMEPQGPFNPRSRTLILQISGEDLLALRQNKINRDEAKARIKESKFPN